MRRSCTGSHSQVLQCFLCIIECGGESNAWEQRKDLHHSGQFWLVETYRSDLCLCDPGILEPKCLHQNQRKTNRQEISCPHGNFHLCAKAAVGEKTSVKKEQTYPNLFNCGPCCFRSLTWGMLACVRTGNVATLSTCTPSHQSANVSVDGASRNTVCHRPPSKLTLLQKLQINEQSKNSRLARNKWPQVLNGSELNLLEAVSNFHDATPTNTQSNLKKGSWMKHLWRCTLVPLKVESDGQSGTTRRNEWKWIACWWDRGQGVHKEPHCCLQTKQFASSGRSLSSLCWANLASFWDSDAFLTLDFNAVTYVRYQAPINSAIRIWSIGWVFFWLYFCMQKDNMDKRKEIAQNHILSISLYHGWSTGTVPKLASHRQ